jgi:hypothetical protein
VLAFNLMMFAIVGVCLAAVHLRLTGLKDGGAYARIGSNAWGPTCACGFPCCVA